MRFLFVAFLSLMTSFSVFAHVDKIPEIIMNNQWDKPISIDKTTKLVLFSTDKNTGNIAKDALNEMRITDLAGKQWVYVADISGMPSIITKMFAMPKMKKYAFPIALDRKGETTKEWPREEDKVAVLVLDELALTKVHYFEDTEALVKFLKAK